MLAAATAAAATARRAAMVMACPCRFVHRLTAPVAGRLGANAGPVATPAPSVQWLQPTTEGQPSTRVLCWTASAPEGTPERRTGTAPPRGPPWQQKARRVASAPQPLGTVVFLHGLNEHGGRIEPWVSFLLGRGLDVVAPDLDGHGFAAHRPGALPSDVHGTTRLVENAATVVRWAATAGRGEEQAPVVLAGFSLGGQVALRAAAQLAGSQHSPLAGTAAIAPLLRVHAESAPPPALIAAAGIIAQLAPWLPVSPGSLGKPYSPTVSSVELAAERTDPFVYTGWMRAGTGMALSRSLRAAPQALRAIGKAGLPVLIQHGDSDRVCDVAGTIAACEDLGAGLVRWGDGAEGGQAASAATEQGRSCAVIYATGHHDLVRERPRLSRAAGHHFAAWCAASVSRATRRA